MSMNRLQRKDGAWHMGSEASTVCTAKLRDMHQVGFGDEDRDRRQQERGERAVIILWNCMHCTHHSPENPLFHCPHLSNFSKEFGSQRQNNSLLNEKLSLNINK
ncbi:hypothetical protein SLE2022_298680 [Rubroshorea leprosula]